MTFQTTDPKPTSARTDPISQNGVLWDAAPAMVRSGSRTALQLGREKVRFSLLTCPPLIIAAEAAWIPARLHSLKVSEPGLS
jgi:hypothetical protein